MPRVAIAVQTVPKNGGAVVIAPAALTAADAANDHTFVNDGATLLMAINEDASPNAVTIVSVADEFGRVGDVLMTVPAATAGVPGVGIAGPFDRELFNQPAADNLVNVDIAADTGLNFVAAKFSKEG